MPIWLRRFTYQSILEHYQKEAEETEKASQGKSQTLTKAPKIPEQAFKKKPDFSVKRPATK